MIVEPEDVFYCHVSVDDIDEIAQKHLKDHQVVDQVTLYRPGDRPSYTTLLRYKLLQEAGACYPA